MALSLDTLPVELRPSPALLRYYALTALLAGPGYPFLFAYLFFRYRTLRYRIDDDGISMRWGALYRREVSLNYGRIQDIHLSSNVVERWLGLGRIQVQTASASSKAEMTIEGVPELRAMRDFLYTRMRGARGSEPSGAGTTAVAGVPAGSGSAPVPAPGGVVDGGDDELTRVLRQVAAEVRALRASLADG
jgi:putative membrane protein